MALKDTKDHAVADGLRGFPVLLSFYDLHLVGLTSRCLLSDH